MRLRYILLAIVILLGFYIAGQVQLRQYKNRCEVLSQGVMQWRECEL